MKPQEIWVEQCHATANIQNHFGVKPAMHYLIGEKFFDFLEAAENDQLFEAEVPKFAERIRTFFDQAVLSEYLIASLHGARDAVLLERARELLLPDEN